MDKDAEALPVTAIRSSQLLGKPSRRSKQGASDSQYQNISAVTAIIPGGLPAALESENFLLWEKEART